jgi:TBC1 domain family protein 5
MNFGVNKFYEDIDETKTPGETKNYLVKRCEYISEKKLKLQNSRLYYHFVNIGIDPGVILQRWIKCLFTREFHPQDCSVIWDAILANEIMEPSGDLSYIDYFSIAMLDFISDELLRKDQNECFKRLFQYPPLESMTTLISLTSRIKPKIIELEKLEAQREKEWKEKTIRNKQQLNEIAEQNKKMRKELEKNIENNKKLNNNNMLFNNFNNILFSNQFNLLQNQNLFLNNNIKYMSPQLNNTQQNQQIFPQMNIMFNNSTNMLININNINNNKEAKKSDKKENKNIKDKNKDNNKSPLDLIKNSYSESIEDKNKMFEEIKNIMNKYKKNFSYEDSTRIDYLFDKLQKKL